MYCVFCRCLQFIIIVISLFVSFEKYSFSGWFTVIIVSAFFMIFAGSFIEDYGFTITLIGMACIGTIAALIMYYGFRFMPQNKTSSNKDLGTYEINPAESQD